MLIIKNFFEKLGVFVEDNTVPITLIVMLLIIISFQGAQLIEMSSGTDTFVDRDSRLYQDFEHLYLDLFGVESIVVMVEGSDIRNPELINAFDRAHDSVQKIPGVVDVTSPSGVMKAVNFQMTGRNKVPDDKAIINEIMDSHMPFSVIPDSTHAVMYVMIEATSSETTMEEILRETEVSIQLAEFPPDYRIIVTGEPAFAIAMNDEMNRSIGTLLMISVILMVAVLYVVFRHVRWRLLPLPIVLVGIIFTFGAMGALGIPMSMVSMAAFPVLIGIGIDYAIQFHNRIEEELERGETEEEAIIETIKHIGPAVLIALIITTLGFFSLFTSSVPMIRDFGTLLIIGIIMCFISSLFLGVTVIYGLHKLSTKGTLSNLGLKRKNHEKITSWKDHRGATKKNHEPDKLEKTLKSIATFSMKNPLIILPIAFVLCLGGIYADSMVPLQTDVETFVPQDMPALIDIKYMGDTLGASDELNLIIMTDDIADPAILKWIDRFSEHEVRYRDNIYASSSIVDIVKDVNGGHIPESSSEVAAVYEDLPQSEKDSFIHGNTILLLNFNIGNAMDDLGLEGIEVLSDIVKDDILWMPPPPDTSVTITGHSVIFVEVISALTSGRIFMTMFGILLVFFGLLVIYRDLIKAVTPVVTMFIVVGLSGGLMYYTGIEYTPMTATLGALILGVGSEYAILMMERYFEEREKGASPEAAMQEASAKIGKAIVTSGMTTVFGFSALIASPFIITSNFGTVTVLLVLMALLATFVILPPLIVSLDKYQEKIKRSMDMNKYNLYVEEGILNKTKEAIGK